MGGRSTYPIAHCLYIYPAFSLLNFFYVMNPSGMGTYTYTIFVFSRVLLVG